MKRRATLNPKPPLVIQGHVDIPPSEVVTLETKDRDEYAPGQPIILNKRRYVLTAREPAGFQEEGAKVYIVLGLDRGTSRKGRRRAAAEARRSV